MTYHHSRRARPLLNGGNVPIRTHDSAAPMSAVPRAMAHTPPAEHPGSLVAPRSLVEQLGEALQHERVVYLQWKGNWKRTRWMSGEGDIDLLVHRSAEARFSAVLWALGFRRADPPPASAIAGIESYFGLDPITGRLIHVHTHYRLVVGGIWRTVYRLPIDAPFIDECLASLRPRYPRWRRLVVRRELHRRLLPHARRPPLTLTLSRMMHRFLTLSGRLKLIRKRGKHFAHGGTVIALLGGDGAGKSTCAREITDWLSDEFGVLTAHLGRPPRSLFTLAVGAAFRIGRLLRLTAEADEDRERVPAYLAALRDVCTAHDRYRLYLQARRFALGGGIALCERYPVPENPTLSGPRLDAFAPLARTRLGRWLVAVEARYYRHILAPDVLVLLRVDPETAVRRKTDEPAEYVRARCQLVWDTDWSGRRVHIVDASRPLADVLAELKTILWREL